MKGVYPQEEIGRLPQDVCVEKVQRLDVPGLDAERHIVILSKRLAHFRRHEYLFCADKGKIPHCFSFFNIRRDTGGT